MENILINDGVVLHVHKTKKFKDTTVTVRFSTPINSKNASARQLLGMMLVDRTSSFSTKVAMQTKCDMLYGANLQHRVIGYGKLHVLDVELHVLNGKLIDVDLLKEQFEFLNEVLFKPLLEPHVFEEAKRLAIERSARDMDDPSSYACDQLFSQGAASSPLAINSKGDANVYSQLGLDDIVKEHKYLLCENMVDVFVVGDVAENDVKSLVEEFLPLKGKREVESFYNLLFEQHDDIFEKKNIQQTMLCQLYRSQITVAEPIFWSLRVLNTILGSSPVSLLFQEVREKRSLCYSVFSTIIAYDGALMIQTGIQKENIDLVLKLVNEQITKLKKGDFSNELIEMSKDILCNNFLTLEDRVSNIIGLSFQDVLLKRTMSISDIITCIRNVDKENVIQVANMLQHQCTFVLEQGEQNETI